MSVKILNLLSNLLDFKYNHKISYGARFTQEGGLDFEIWFTESNSVFEKEARHFSF